MPLQTQPPEGTLVRCTSDICSGQFTKDQTYVVGGRYFADNARWIRSYLSVVEDDRGVDNGWMCKYFELAGGPW